jgi:hypothetical protein
MWRIGSQMPPSLMMIPCDVLAGAERVGPDWGATTAAFADIEVAAAARSPAATARVTTRCLTLVLNMMLPFRSGAWPHAGAGGDRHGPR